MQREYVIHMSIPPIELLPPYSEFYYADAERDTAIIAALSHFREGGVEMTDAMEYVDGIVQNMEYNIDSDYRKGELPEGIKQGVDLYQAIYDVMWEYLSTCAAYAHEALRQAEVTRDMPDGTIVKFRRIIEGIYLIKVEDVGWNT